MADANVHVEKDKNIQGRVESQAKICVEIVSKICRAVESGYPADRELAKILRSRKEIGSRDRKLLSDLVFAVFRWMGWTKCWRDTCLQKMLLSSIFLEGKTGHEVARKWAHELELPEGWDLCSISDSLEEKLEALERVFGGGDLNRTWMDLFPKWFYHELYVPEEYGSDEGIQKFKKIIFTIFQTRPPVWIRIVESFRIQVIQDLKKSGVDFHFDEELENAASLHSPVNLNLLPSYKKGKFEVQDFSSQMVGHVCSPQPGETWWDVCSGAGGKALHLSDLMKGRGRVVATDVRKSSLLEFQRRLNKTQKKNILTHSCKEGKEWDGKTMFDGVLVDAPCSGTGVWRRNPDARWRITENDLITFATCQTDLLTRCKESVRPGGVLVYSVCSITQAETEGVVETFLNQSPDFKLHPFLDPLKKMGTSGKFWIWPDKKNSDAMFITRFQRKT